MAAGERICLGRVIGAHGLDGTVVIRSYTAEPADIGAYGPLADAEGARRFAVAVRRVTRKGVLARIEGVDDRAAAEALKGTELYVARDALPEPDADEFYYADLIGLQVDDTDGHRMGTVRRMENYGAGDVLEVALDDGGELLVPFTKAVVPVVEVAAGRIVVDPPAELPVGADEGTEG